MGRLDSTRWRPTWASTASAASGATSTARSSRRTPASRSSPSTTSRSPEILAHMLKYDSTLGVLDGDDRATRRTRSRSTATPSSVLSERDPSALPWKDMGVDVVVESTGLFTDREGASQHLTAGAEKVVISAPATDPDITIVLGVNDDKYDPEQHHIISNASCTTNCVGADGEDPARLIRARRGLHDDDPRLHDRAAAPGPDPSHAEGQGRPAPDARRAPEHHPGLDRRREGDRRGDPRAQGQGRRDGDARARFRTGA